MKYLLPFLFLFPAAMVKEPVSTNAPVVVQTCVYKRVARESWEVSCTRKVFVPDAPVKVKMGEKYSHKQP